MSQNRKGERGMACCHRFVLGKMFPPLAVWLHAHLNSALILGLLQKLPASSVDYGVVEWRRDPYIYTAGEQGMGRARDPGFFGGGERSGGLEWGSALAAPRGGDGLVVQPWQKLLVYALQVWPLCKPFVTRTLHALDKQQSVAAFVVWCSSSLYHKPPPAFGGINTVLEWWRLPRQAVRHHAITSLAFLCFLANGACIVPRLFGF